MQKAYLLSSLLFATLLCAEPSAFDDSSASQQQQNVQQNSPQNTQKLKNQPKQAVSEDFKYNLDALQDLVSSQGEQISKMQREFSANITSDNQGSLRDLNKRFEESLKIQNENYEKINAAMSQLAQIIDSITENYVTKEQLKLNMGKNYKDLKNQIAKKATDANTSTKASDKKQVAETKAVSDNLDDTYNSAIKDYKANNIDGARTKFEDLEKTDFPKKAVVEYYLGEIAYKKGDYKTAIDYYQKSIDADEKTSFVPMILYHTAYSLEKLGDKTSAKKILQNLIANYPDNYLVPSAKKKLAELK